MKALWFVIALASSVLGLAFIVGSFSLGPADLGDRVVYWLLGFLLLFVSHLIERKKNHE